MIELGFIFTKGEIKMATAMANIQSSLDPRLKLSMPKVYYKGELLSDTQVSILTLVGEAMTNTEIAEILCISKRTVEAHLAKTRNLITKIDGYRPKERSLVIFAREMLDGYEAFLRIRRKQQREKGLEFNSDIELIEDWDDEEILEADQEPFGKDKVIELDQFRLEYEIADFATEEKEIRLANGKYYLV